MRNQLTEKIVLVAISSVLGLGAAWAQTQDQAQPAQPQEQKQAQPAEPKKPEWKDRAEYDLYTSIAGEKDNKKKLDLLNQWKEKYASSDFKVLRLEIYLDTYRQLGDPGKMLETAQELLKEDPKNITALYWTNLLVVSSFNPRQPDPVKLDLGEQVANTVLNNVDALFAADKRPPAMQENVWKQYRTDTEVAAHRTLGFVNLQRKNYPEAEKQLTASLKLNPNDAEAAYWLGSAVRNQAPTNPARQPDALYQFARAVAYEGPGALPAANKKLAQNYLTDFYNRYHGEDPQGLAHLLEVAKTNPFAPADFKILSQEEIKEERLKNADPSLRFWVTALKEPLGAADGATFYENSVKGFEIPPPDQPLLQGAVIRQEPALKPKIVVLGIADPAAPEVTLKLDTPMAVAAPVGTVIKFRGVASGFTANPFMLTFDVEKKNVTGWPAPPPPAKKAPLKKAAPKK